MGYYPLKGVGIGREFSPAELGLGPIDLEATAATYTGNIIRLYGYSDIVLVMRYVIVGTLDSGSTVHFDLDILSEDGTTVLVNAARVLTGAAAASGTAAGTKVHLLRMGGRVAATQFVQTITAGTTILANSDVITAIPGIWRPKIVVATAAVGGTSATLNCWLMALK